MSAWYVFSSLGFYPVTPASNQYIIGSPLFEKATINLEDGKTFTVAAENISEENKYIKAVYLNGKKHPNSYINHSDIMNGGSLVFEMTNAPTNWGTQDKNIPKTEIKEHQIIPAPFIAKGDVAFKGSTEVSLETVDKDATIYYSFGGDYQQYESPITISEKSSISVYAEKEDQKSATITTDFYKIDPNIKIELKTKYANQYNAGGDNALIDGIIGAEDFRTGTWQGYWNEDVVAIVDLGKNRMMNSIEVGFLRDQRSWIFLPTNVEIHVSLDGKRFRKIKDWKAPKPFNTDEVVIEKVKTRQTINVRYIKLVAKKLGKLPKWHLGYPHDGRSWIFVDEIQIK